MSANAPISCPEKFSFVSNEWPNWKRRFERYVSVSGLAAKTDLEKINALIYLMGDKADDIFLALEFATVPDKVKYDKVLEAFEAYFIVRRNTIYERAKFNLRVQLEGETSEDFITALYALAQHCDYKTLNDEMIRDRIVVGVRNRKLSEKLQLDSALTLKKAIDTTRNYENVRNQQDDLRNETAPNVDVVRKQTARTRNEGQRARVCEPKSSAKPEKPSGSRAKSDSGQSCGFCGYNSHARDKCPARKSTCNKCSKTGHFAKVCRQKSAAAEVTLDSLYLCPVENDTENDIRPWTATVTVSNVPIVFKLDSGADVTVLPSSLTSKFPRLVQKPTQVLRGPANTLLPTTGEMKVKLCHSSCEFEDRVFFVKGLTHPLLSRRACLTFKLVTRVEAVSTDTTTVRPETEFPKLFEGLGKLNEPHTIRLKDNAVPVSVSVPRRVAIPLMDKLKTQLEEMVLMDVITPVDEPTEWCSPMVVATKPNGKLRICVDLTEINKNVLRELHPMATVEYSLGLLGGAVYKSKIDGRDSFWQCPLDPESQLLTTFITPFGRYCFLRLPYGISSAPEVFQKRMTHILRGIPGVVCHMDDIIVGGSTLPEHDDRLRKVLQRLQDAGMTLNIDKCVFCATKLNFLGHTLDESGIHPDNNKVSAIVNMSVPQNVTEVRRFLGLANYLGRFVPNMAEIAAPLYELLKAKSEFLWGPSQQQSFDKIKVTVSSEPVLVPFDVTKPTRVSADSSSYGLGAVLKQKQDDSSHRPVAFASRTLSVAEKRYAQIEKEALAFTWACERFKDFVTGMPFEIQTDHKPLVPIFTIKHLDDLTPRLQRFRLRMMRYSYSIFYTPGKDLIVADTLSRSPLTEIGSRELEEETAAYVHSVISSIPTSDELLQKIWQQQQADPVLQKVANYSATGWPTNKKCIDTSCHDFWAVRYEIAEEDGLLLRGQRLIIPKAMQPEIMERIHDGHQGITKCRARARASVWWPGLSKDIEECVRKCLICIKEVSNRHEPLIPADFPARPWQKVAMDLFHLEGKCFILIVDFFSRYPEIAQLEKQTADCVILHCKSVFARHGIPETVVTDNGPQFHSLIGSPFTQFAKCYGFVHQTSSPKFPQSNGFAEAGVKIVKACLKKNPDPYLGLLEYRATPLYNGYSPAELLMSRKLRSRLPVISSHLIPKEVPLKMLRGKEERRRSSQKANYDNRHGVHNKDDPDDGEVVWIRDMRTWGTIKQKASQPRSYIIQTQRGEVRRNRFHITRAKTKELPDEATLDDDVPDTPEPEEPIPAPAPRGRRRREQQQRQRDNQSPPVPARPRRVAVPIQRLNYERLGQPSV